MEVDEERVRVLVVEVAEEVLVQVDQVAVVRDASGVRVGWRILRQADRALEVKVALLPATSALRVFRSRAPRANKKGARARILRKQPLGPLLFGSVATNHSWLRKWGVSP